MGRPGILKATINLVNCLKTEVRVWYGKRGKELDQNKYQLMKLLEDILQILGVAGREAEKVISDMHTLADSRGARKLVVRLPKLARQRLDENLEISESGKHAQIIRAAIEQNCSEQEKQRAYKEALGEIIQEVFLPTVLQEARPSQKQAIHKIVNGE